MADRDCRSFDLVSAAYGMPKDGDEQKKLREKAIQEAMVGAMVVPEETLCMVRDVFVAMESVIPCIGKAIVSDLASGASLLLAAAEGAFLNVRINATYLTNRDLADRTMERATSVLTEIRRHQGSIAVSVDKMLVMSNRRPPLLLVVLDGFGDAPAGPGNAISLAAPALLERPA
jgi:formiminotetrahydrofolate cyclodeaminase